MLLSEMSLDYQKAQIALSARMRQLRAAAKTEPDPGKAADLLARAWALDPLLRETRALAELTARYYERSYHKDEKYSL